MSIYNTPKMWLNLTTENLDLDKNNLGEMDVQQYFLGRMWFLI